MELYERKSKIGEYIQLGMKLREVSGEEDLRTISLCVGSLEEVLKNVENEILFNSVSKDIRLRIGIWEGRYVEMKEFAIEEYKMLGDTKEEAEKRWHRTFDNLEESAERTRKDGRLCRYLGYLLTPIKKSSDRYHEMADTCEELSRLLLDYAKIEKSKMRAKEEITNAAKRLNDSKKAFASIFRKKGIDADTAMEMVGKAEEYVYEILDEVRIKYGL